MGLFGGYWGVSRMLSGSSNRAWHEVLGVSPHATLDEIQRAFDQLSSHHQANPERSRELSAAYNEALRQRH